MKPEQSPLNEETIQVAHKIDHLVDKKEVSKKEASGASAEQLDLMVKKIFDEKYWMQLDSLRVDEKRPGQKAEDVFVEILNHPPFHAEHASAHADQKDKVDILLTIDGEKKPIKIQMTAKVEPADVERKKKQLSPDTLFIIIPAVGKVLDAKMRENARELRGFFMDFMRSLLREMRSNPEYHDMYDHLVERFPLQKAA